MKEMIKIFAKLHSKQMLAKSEYSKNEKQKELFEKLEKTTLMAKSLAVEIRDMEKQGVEKK